MKIRTNCSIGGCGKVDNNGEMCKYCGFDAVQQRIRKTMIKQHRLRRDPATGLCKLIVHGRYSSNHGLET